MAKKLPRHLEFRNRVRVLENIRVTLIYCLDMLKPLHEKLPIAFGDDAPHGMRKSWIGTAEINLAMVLQDVVEKEL